MSNNQKIETMLLAALDSTPEQIESSSALSAGIDLSNDVWQLIVRYTDDLSDLERKYPGIKTITLLNGYGIIFTPREFIDSVASEERIIYIEKPKSFYYQTYSARQASCINSAQNRYSGLLTGRGTYVAIIDSGIDYSHPDFRNPDGSTRIKYLWDQTITPTIPSPMDLQTSPYPVPFGTIYDEATINMALSAATTEERYSICPSIDISGHGTHVAGIAAGNGAASNGINRGVAYEAWLIIVKLAPVTNTTFPGTVSIMTAVDFCIRQSLLLNSPVAINLSFGNTYGSHSGSSLLETYLDSVMGLYQSCIVVGSGNEGSSAGHASFSKDSNRNTQEISVSDFTPNLSILLWKRFWDDITFELTAPNGQYLLLPSEAGSYNFTIGNDNVFIFIGEPTPYNIFQEYFIELQNDRNSYISQGIWRISYKNNSQKEMSNISLWLTASGTRSQATRFLTPDIYTTLTIPSTASKVITVGAYDSNTDRIASFSGRGYTWGNPMYKPDLVAPGVDISSCSPGGGYTIRSGTSMATPFVTGSCAALMQWGIIEGNDAFLYGEKMKAALINGARILPGEDSFPNPFYGWGALCLLDSIP